MNNPQETFEAARRLYPGVKRGQTTEWVNFQKKYGNSKEILALLQTAIESQAGIKAALRRTGKFCPEWPHFRTWINNRRWEDEIQKTFNGRLNQTVEMPKLPSSEMTEAQENWFRKNNPEIYKPDGSIDFSKVGRNMVNIPRGKNGEILI
jgi:hypothetical protein